MAAVLALQHLLLHQFVRNLKTGAIKTERKAHPVFLAQIALETPFDSSQSSAVSEVLQHGRIEKAVGAGRIHGETEDVPAVEITGTEVSIPGVETASAQNRSTVQPARGIAVTRSFDHASNLAAKFGWNPRGVGLDRLHIVQVIRGRKSRGPVVQDRESIDDVLRVVFGTSRMQHSVGLEQPARLRLDNVNRLAPRSSGCPIPQRGRAKLVNVAHVGGIEERVRIFDFNRLRNRSDRERDGQSLRKLRADFDQRIVSCEARVLDRQMVSPQWQFFGGVFATRGSSKSEFEVARLADQKTMGRQDSSVGIGDREAKLTGAILRANRRNAQQQRQRSDDENNAQIHSPNSASNALVIVYSPQSAGYWPVAVRLPGNAFGWRSGLALRYQACFNDGFSRASGATKPTVAWSLKTLNLKPPPLT